MTMCWVYFHDSPNDKGLFTRTVYQVPWLRDYHKHMHENSVSSPEPFISWSLMGSSRPYLGLLGGGPLHQRWRWLVVTRCRCRSEIRRQGRQRWTDDVSDLPSHPPPLSLWDAVTWPVHSCCHLTAPPPPTHTPTVIILWCWWLYPHVWR